MDKSALHKLSYGLYVAGTRWEDGFCGCIVDALVQAATMPLTIVLCSMKGGHTNAAIKKSGEFSLSVLPTDVDPFIIANFGFQSSRDINKWGNVFHTTLEGLPVLEKCAASIACKVFDIKELDSHTVFFAEVINAVKGEGKPLIYGDYLNGDLKKRTIEAFKAHRRLTAGKTN